MQILHPFLSSIFIFQFFYQLRLQLRKRSHRSVKLQTSNLLLIWRDTDNWIGVIEDTRRREDNDDIINYRSSSQFCFSNRVTSSKMANLCISMSPSCIMKFRPASRFDRFRSNYHSHYNASVMPVSIPGCRSQLCNSALSYFWYSFDQWLKGIACLRQATNKMYTLKGRLWQWLPMMPNTPLGHPSQRSHYGLWDDVTMEMW